jgi:hypothetical protein
MKFFLSDRTRQYWNHRTDGVVEIINKMDTSENDGTYSVEKGRTCMFRGFNTRNLSKTVIQIRNSPNTCVRRNVYVVF